METERRRQLRIVDRGLADDRSRIHSLPSDKDRWREWVDEMWSETARVHTLIDKVHAELSQMVSDDSIQALKVLEKNAELRVLQAYYKGLRFAIDRKKEIAGRRIVDTVKPL